MLESPIISRHHACGTSQPLRDAHQEPFTFNDAIQSIQQGRDTLDQATSLLLAQLKDAERLSLLDGDVPFWHGLRTILCDRYNRHPFVMGHIPRLNIPGIRFTDGPRGVVMGASTCFPVAMARGATWDVELEQRIGDAIGLEGRAQGANYFAGICINLPRHPAWGRIQETYGEDPLLLGEFGVALHRGVRKNMMTCVKHFALNSMENARFQVDVQVDEAALHEVYLPHFRRLVEDGVSSVMSSYNSVRGEYAGQNYELLTEILRKQWNFDGFVLSDFIFGLRDAALSVKNGLDIEAPFQQQRAMALGKALSEGKLLWSDVDAACARILRKQLQHVLDASTKVPSTAVVFSDEHRQLAREAAARGMTLLKNEAVGSTPLLPLDSKKLKTVAVIGRLATSANLGDHGSSSVFPPRVTTIYEGLKAALPNTDVRLENNDSVEHASQLAAQVDLVLCVVGYDATDEGEYVVPSFESNPELEDLLPPVASSEDRATKGMVMGKSGTTSGGEDNVGLVPGAGGDRKSLRLRPRDVEIIHAVFKTNPKTVVSVIAAGAVIMEEWIESVPSVLMSWYSGCEGGHALADVLLGKIDASGRLPFSIPRDESHLPDFDINATSITYDRWFGQRLLDKDGNTPRFPLGHGLSFTSFKIREPVVDTSELREGKENFSISVTVCNVGSREGRHVAQVYGVMNVKDFPWRVLLGFKPVDVSAGAVGTIRIPCSTRPLRRWQAGNWEYASTVAGIEVAAYSGDVKCSRTFITL